MRILIVATAFAGLLWNTGAGATAPFPDLREPDLAHVCKGTTIACDITNGGAPCDAPELCVIDYAKGKGSSFVADVTLAFDDDGGGTVTFSAEVKNGKERHVYSNVGDFSFLADWFLSSEQDLVNLSPNGSLDCFQTPEGKYDRDSFQGFVLAVPPDPALVTVLQDLFGFPGATPVIERVLKVSSVDCREADALGTTIKAKVKVRFVNP